MSPAQGGAQRLQTGDAAPLPAPSPGPHCPHALLLLCSATVWNPSAGVMACGSTHPVMGTLCRLPSYVQTVPDLQVYDLPRTTLQCACNGVGGEHVP